VALHEHEFDLPDEDATRRLGAALAAALRTHLPAITAEGLVVGLSGDLGAGKTALTRATLRALDVSGPVKSPTFTLLEPYALSSINFYHFDFYRFSNPEEFSAAGFRELFGPAAVVGGSMGRANVCFVEWPERATGTLPTIDLSLSLSMQEGDDAARRCRAQAASTLGSACLESTISSFEAAAAGSSARQPPGR
jgi:tRNA threonylcarbamoyladenosine biosynthesis protein TsaE